jgi:hypothetical protein
MPTGPSLNSDPLAPTQDGYLNRADRRVASLSGPPITLPTPTPAGPARRRPRRLLLADPEAPMTSQHPVTTCGTGSTR